ncbi:hypothetical protein SAMN03159341_11933 [Paenibacillus sp. 1_12]|nr:hypothetical protein SAMN03159341_11933 [Paenibacillus sp. 1_12]
MPRKILRSQSAEYPFHIKLNETMVVTREGTGIVTSRANEWIYVKLDRTDKIIKTSIFFVELLETA